MKISFIIATYNRPDTLKRAIESVLVQNHKDVEILVVSDGHSFVNKAVADMFCDERVVYCEALRDGGWSARNTGIDEATGDFLVFLDDDNEIHPNYTDVLVPLLKKYTGMICYKITLHDKHWATRDVPPDHSITLNHIDTLNIITHREIATSVRWEKDERYECCPDWVYFNKCETICNGLGMDLVYIDDVLAVHNK